jgi:hypothetical protein
MPEYSVQSPVAGDFNRTDLQWEEVPITHGHSKGLHQKRALVYTNRVKDFINGEGTFADTGFFMERRVKRPNWTKEYYHCWAGPEDNSDARPTQLLQSKEPGKRIGKVQRGKSCKVGCTMEIVVTHMHDTAATEPVSRLECSSFEHVNQDGDVCHGPGLHSLTQHRHAAHLSKATRAWVKTMLFAGFSTRQILMENDKRMKAAMQQGGTGWCNRDLMLRAQDVRNCEQEVAVTLWRWHPVEAQSVRMFTEMHPDFIFIYKEQINDQQQPFVLGMVTANMLQTALKYGDGNAVLMDATFGTNHLRMHLHTGLVMDAHGNGLPIFHVLSQRQQQEDLQEWLLAFKSLMLQHNSTWQPSCFLVDDAQAEINAIRYTNAIF